MFRKVTALALLSCLSLVGCTSTKGHDGEWVKLATKTVNYQAETDTVKPLPFVGKQNLSHIKIKCIQGTINIKSLTVTMSDGSTKDLNTLGVLSKGMSTRSFSLPGEDTAKFKRLDMNYDSVGSASLGIVGVSKKGKVEVWGQIRTSK